MLAGEASLVRHVLNELNGAELGGCAHVLPACRSGSASIVAVSKHVARLEDVDLTARLSRDEEEKRLRKAQLRLLHLRLIIGGQLAGGVLGPPVCIVFEGWDAAGKGGAIERLCEPLDPRHVHIAPFAAPTPDELRHHFLWRFWPPLPGWGGMTIFDRSWYGRVLVERVENSRPRSSGAAPMTRSTTSSTLWPKRG